MRHVLPYLALVLAAGAAPLAAPRAALAEAQDLGPATSRLTMQVGQARMIRLDGMAKSVFVADPKIADVDVRSPSLIYVTAKAPGVTTLIAMDADNRMLANIEIATDYDEGQLQDDLKRYVPGSDITVSTSNGALVLTGRARSPADADTARSLALHYAPDAQHMIDRIAVDQPDQVNLRVRFAEVSRDLVKQFGFNWSVAATPGQGMFGLSTGSGSFMGGPADAGKTVPIGPSSVVSTASTTADNVLLGFANNTVAVQLLIDALDTEGLVKILAEPNLTAVSGVPATFLAGGEYPIPVPQALGVTTIEYKDYGVSLSFVATVLDGNRINLVVKPEVSQITQQGAVSINGTSIPALTIRRMSTTVDMASGQSFAIAGLLQNTTNQSISRFPGLGNLPVLGALFRSDSFERDETELVVIVTPYIVRPVSGRLAAPTDGYTAPTDAARLFLGSSYMTHPAGAGSPISRSGGGLIGPGGFELE
ncbi:MAG TPA: type II and III secretion system protein family protein [Caulobacteraceae bacterium]|jgi:pilus assembly protein CpaC